MHSKANSAFQAPLRVTALIFASALAGCTSPASISKDTPMTGADRDAHGCISSAGYAWCARTAQCERPWELAAQQGFEVSVERYEAWCSAMPTP